MMRRDRDTCRRSRHRARRGALGTRARREESRRTKGTRTENGDRRLGIGRQMLTLGLNLVAPIALYYGLRAAGVGIYLALIVGAVVPALGAVGQRSSGASGSTAWACS